MEQVNSVKRSIAKTITYRLISSGIGFLVVWWISGNAMAGGMFSIAELIYKPLQYYIHERVWQRINWGKN